MTAQHTCCLPELMPPWCHAVHVLTASEPGWRAQEQQQQYMARLLQLVRQREQQADAASKVCTPVAMRCHERVAQSGAYMCPVAKTACLVRLSACIGQAETKAALAGSCAAACACSQGWQPPNGPASPTTNVQRATSTIRCGSFTPCSCGVVPHQVLCSLTLAFWMQVQHS